MNIPRLFYFLVAVVTGQSLFCTVAMGQVEIKGTVYDRSAFYAMPGVSVLAASGAGTMTDSLGRYQIRLSPDDSIYFSYLGKFTAKFPVKDMPAGSPFDMSLQVSIDTLPSVFVRPKDYRQDSLENREEYRKIFDYSPNFLGNMKMPKGSRGGGMGVGFSLDMILDAKHNRWMESMKSRLEWEEQDNYIDHRFNRALVKRITGLEAPALDTFMKIYRPSYEMLKSFETEYQYYKYIFDWGKTYSEIWKQEHPN
jgi:hypothetical protein